MSVVDVGLHLLGANIYPQDIEAAIYTAPDLAACMRSFWLDIAELVPGETRPRIWIQLESVEPTAELQERFATVLVDRLLAMNRDYQEAAQEYPDLMRPIVQLCRTGEGPFAGADHRIKFRYLAP